MTEDQLDLSVAELGPLLRDRKLSPVELAEGYLKRLETHGEKLGAVITIARESGLKEARAAEKAIQAGNYLGPLHGIPYGVKDLLATKGLPTTWGAKPYEKRIIDDDATLIVKLRQAGAVLLAKLAMVELAGAFGYQTADASFTGPAKNPWNRDFWAGGSSSGPGAAVAAGLVPWAIGSETSGSIVTPAAFCGLSALRPTYGRLSRHGAMALCWTLDKLGPMCRSAEDAALVMASIVGPDPLDRSCRDKPWKLNALPEKKLRLGIIKGSFVGVQPAVRDNMKAALEVLGTIGDLDAKEVPIPPFPYGAAVGLIVDAEGASAFRELIESGKVAQLQDDSDKIGGYAATMVLAVDYLQAMRIRPKMRKAWAELYQKYDVLIAPGRETVAPPLAKDAGLSYPNSNCPAIGVIGAGNLVGHPALTLPTGLGDNNLPTGLQLLGPAWSEPLLLRLGMEYQARTKWHQRHPMLP